MSRAKPMTKERRMENYMKQNGGSKLTLRQMRQIRKQKKREEKE